MQNLPQVTEKSTRRGVLMDLVLKNKDKLLGAVKVGGSLGCSDHEMVESGSCMEEAGQTASVTPVFKKGKKEDPGNYRPVTRTYIPGKVMEQLILDVISKYVEEKEVISSGQHGFTKGKLCLTNLIAFYNGMTGWIDEGRAVDAVYLEAFDTVSHNTLIGKLRKCGVDEWTVRWIENWLSGRTQRAVISSTEAAALEA
ncbi:rna-directed dna polymerase from mobile element jockey- hypothetical protein [Limosa lapponica baueri]|uniref:Reverse transcriptase domain-containing protein n=1 Tax=Limosa lapponica baueri TaxID=1758121 RepID=A0A2I0U3B4_LIMLA|nr:rna-directed dna polymerase from mobile element jockey- hypothetical protein [Limosa lapponica baueri]